MTDCTAHATLVVPASTATTTWVGGITGDLEDNALVRRATLTNCHWTGSITVNNEGNRARIGGVTGRCQVSDIYSCSAKGVITVDWPTDAGYDTNGRTALIVGGAIGLHAGTLSTSFSDCDISVGYNTSAQVGGAIGHGYGGCSATDCYTLGSLTDLITGTTVLNFPNGGGGFAGALNASSDAATRCWSAASAFSAASGNVVVKPFIGVAGVTGTAVLTDCFWDKTLNNWGSDATGLVGKTTTELKTAATFSDYVLSPTENYKWRMCADGVDYPHLTWEYVQAGDFACPDGVAFDDLARLAADWLLTYSTTLHGADATGDSSVNFADFAILAANWMQ
jgi:hypothetical protein